MQGVKVVDKVEQRGDGVGGSGFELFVLYECVVFFSSMPHQHKQQARSLSLCALLLHGNHAFYCKLWLSPWEKFAHVRRMRVVLVLGVLRTSSVIHVVNAPLHHNEICFDCFFVPCLPLTFVIELA